MPVAPTAIRFADFRFDPTTLELTRKGMTVPLSRLPLRILDMLLRSGGRIVTRAQLKQDLWPHALRIDTERRLNTAVRALREALGDNGRDPRFIETLRGRGYRWIAVETARVSRSFARRLAPLAMTFLLLLVGSAGRLSEPPTAAQRATLVRLAAQPDRHFAILGVEQLIRQRPSFTDAYRLRGQLAVEIWRERGDSGRLRAAEAAVNAAVEAGGESATLEVLAAELAMAGRWDWRAAEGYYRSALRLDPDHVAARRGLAWLYVNSGRQRQAWAEITRLMALSLPSAESRADLGWLFLRMGRPDLARMMCSGPVRGINLLACRFSAEARTGAMASARQTAIALMTEAGADPTAMAGVSEAPADLALRRFLDWQATSFLPRDASAFHRAQVEAAAGRHKAALDHLERALAERDPLLVKLGSTPEFAPLERSPRFRRLLETVLASA